MNEQQQAVIEYVKNSTEEYEEGAAMFDRITTGEYVDFLTLPAYEAMA